MTLKPGSTVRGVVVDEAGRPVGGVRIIRLDDATVAGVPIFWPPTDARGAFQSDCVPLERNIRLSIAKAGYFLHNQRITLSPERREVDLKITLRKQPYGGGLEGFVRDEKGRPVAGARVENQSTRPRDIRKTTTDRDGHYVLDDVLESPDGFKVVVLAPGKSPHEQAVKPGPPGKRARVDFALAPGHILHGRVVLENGKPAAGVEVRWLWGREGQTDADGRVEIDSLPAVATFQLEKSGYTPVSAPLRLDSTGLVTVVLQPMGVIRGRVVDARSGKPLTQFNVWFNAAVTAHESHVQVGSGGSLNYPGRRVATKDGTFTMPNLSNGEAVAVSVAADGYLKCVAPVVVAAPGDEAKPVAFALERIDPRRMTTFSGRVVDAADHPIGGASVRLIFSEHDDKELTARMGVSGEIRNGLAAGDTICDQFLEATSDAQGNFEFKDVLPDKYWHLSWWNKPTVEHHQSSSEKTKLGHPQNVTLRLEETPGRILVTINLAKYPKAFLLVASRPGVIASPAQFEINPGQTTYDFEDVQPGNYNILILAKPVLTKNAEGELDPSPQPIANRRIQVKKGETAEVRF